MAAANENQKIWAAIAIALTDFAKTKDTTNLVKCARTALARRRCVAWEVGPDPRSKHLWSFSLRLPDRPDCEQEVIRFFADRIDLDGWRFYLGLPPKNWELYFEILPGGKNPVPIEGKDWSYTIESDEAGCQLTLFVDGKVKQHVLEEAAEILVMSEIGEANRAQYVTRLSIADYAARSKSAAVRPFGSLAPDFASRFPQCQWADVLLKKVNGIYESGR